VTRTEHLLCSAAEECAEVAQRISKALRFGLEEVQPGQEKTNAERIMDEWDDLTTVMAMLANEGRLPTRPGGDAGKAKRAEIEKYLAYSRECGTLTEA
jgi:hypothetical protein